MNGTYTGTWRALVAILALLVQFFALAERVEAHRPGESYIYLDVSEGPLLGEFHIRFEDLTKAIPLDTDGDGVITDEEVLAKQPEIAPYLTERLRFHDATGSHVPVTGEMEFFGPRRARQMKLHFSVPTLDPPPDRIDAEYRFLYDGIDPDHRPMLLQDSNTRMRLDENEWFVSLVFEPGAERQTENLLPPPASALIPEFIRHGFFQIVLHPFHLAIALVALIPCVRRRSSDAAVPVQQPGEVARAALWTAFLLALGFGLGILFRQFVDYRLRDVEILAFLLAALVVLALDNVPAPNKLRRRLALLAAGVFCGVSRSSYSGVVGLNKGLIEITIPSFGVGLFAAICLLAAAALPIIYLTMQRIPASGAAIRAGSVALSVGGTAYLLYRWLL